MLVPDVHEERMTKSVKGRQPLVRVSLEQLTKKVNGRLVPTVTLDIGKVDLLGGNILKDVHVALARKGEVFGYQ